MLAIKMVRGVAIYQCSGRSNPDRWCSPLVILLARFYRMELLLETDVSLIHDSLYCYKNALAGALLWKVPLQAIEPLGQRYVISPNAC